jgi:cytochrome d ubiquinol oxidase subunit I
VRGGLAVPGALSFLMYNDWNKPIAALDNPDNVPGGLHPGETVHNYWPPVNATFQTYHLMVALGMLFIALSVTGSILLWRGRLYRMRWLLYLLVIAVIGPVIANQAGWASAEVGRQPWIVYGMMKTADAASPVVSANEIVASIAMFGVIYLLLFLVWLYLMDQKIRTGPESPEHLAAQPPPAGWLHVSTERSHLAAPTPGSNATGNGERAS